MFIAKRRQQAIAGVESHVRDFFAGHGQVQAHDYDLGPGRREAVPGLRVIAASPGPRANAWTYVTAGCWSMVEKNGHGLEFALTAPAGDVSFVDLLAKIAYYHAGHHLDLEHSMPIGEPWMPGSSCDHLLISLPYMHGPDLERCPLPNGHARILWALPVTAAEIAYRREHGHEALEQLFDEHEIEPTDPKRASVV
ncbi:suppressor of fused domain protein [Streptacidiphilus fuscans]|uniref:Suppressor of fused domain protein n=1 Tax=Streptacidiphilus fuscans TaxID=2789292 RepID=A0A931B742_9ACTN|nr:suppressor of fused domain protein [Streptacidiphilus fuscans]MBF9071366.1 suppressor of fused domain protein [Streptacidiphilus fuscans]